MRSEYVRSECVKCEWVRSGVRSECMRICECVRCECVSL